MSERSDKEHDGRRFVIRTIRDGAVRIYGLTFRPSGHHRKYDGRLDGLRFAFGLYYEPGGKWDPRHVECWGPEAMYRAASEEDYKREWQTNPACVDGAFCWDAWYSEHVPWACPSCAVMVAFEDEHDVMACFCRQREVPA